jgi:hypothetical protein
VIGTMGEHSHTWTSLQPAGSIDVNSGLGGLYATWFSHGAYLNGGIYGGAANYTLVAPDCRAWPPGRPQDRNGAPS